MQDLIDVSWKCMCFSAAKLAALVYLIHLTYAIATAADDVPSELPQILTIEWKKGPSLPQGFQDSQGGIIAGHLISVAGFCSGEQGVPGKPEKYPRGFLRDVWALDLRVPNDGWRRLPDFPGAARQGMQAIVVGGRLYCWGGFSYSAPFCYRDGYVLSHEAGGWHWSRLPDMRRAVTAAGIAAVGIKVFVIGGADYDLERFYTESDRTGGTERLGARLISIDTTNVDAGWREEPSCPGTPRWVHATAAVDGELYVFGGATGSDNEQSATYTVVDNWRYSTTTKNWEGLGDLPVASGNFPSGAIVYANRYVLLVGGYQYGGVMGPDGAISPAYGTPQRHYAENPMCSDVFVYDTRTATFGRATPLPLNNNLPMTVVAGDTIHLIGGEIGAATIDGEPFGHHPDLYLVGKIREVAKQ